MNTTLLHTDSWSDQDDDYVYVYIDPPFSDNEILFINVFLRILLTGGLSIFGIASNVVNLIVFYKQGPLSSSPTVILTGLSLSDFLVCVFSLFSIVFAILETCFDYSTWSWEVTYFNAILTSRPLNLLSQVTCWLTTFMAFERAVSVAFPFKVKTMFTPRRSLVGVMSICLALLFIHIPDLIEYSIGTKKNKYTNGSYVIFDYSHYLPKIFLTVFFYLSFIFLRFASLLIVVLCNVVIIWKVKSSQKFRESKTNVAFSSSQPGTHNAPNHSVESKGTRTTSKEIKLLRMISAISVVFCGCYCLSILHTIVFYLVLDTTDYHWRMDYVVYDVIRMFLIFNSSINMVIYYNMSSQYKEELKLCLSKGKRNKVC